MIDQIKSATSYPHYSRTHTGSCLVIGSAWCADDDVSRAVALRPDVFFIGVNRSVSHFKCEMMVAIDRGKAEKWKADGVSKYGCIELHGGIKRDNFQEVHPWFDYFWPDLQHPSGTSAMMASRIAIAVGFEEIILCGCPIEPGPYLDGTEGWSKRHHTALEPYRQPWVAASGYLKGIVFSMSGFTRELFGEP